VIKFVSDWWFSPGTLVSSTNKTDCYDITEILLKVALNTINLNLMFIMSILFQVLKLYAWELLFKEKILSIRKTEMKILWKASIIGIGFTFSWTVAPYIVSHYIYICV
jgi:hypothetical protein